MSYSTSQNTTLDSSHLNTSDAFVSRQLSTVHFYIFLVFSVLLAVVILIGNTLVIVAYKCNVRLQNGTNCFLASLAACDVIVGVASIPLWIYISHVPHPKVLYTIFIMLDIVSALASIFHLTAICVERYVAFWKPFCHRSVNPRVFNSMIVAAWFFAIFVALVYPLQKKYSFTKPYVMVVFTLGFAAPLATICLMHIAIYRISRRVLRSKTVRYLTQRNMERHVVRHLKKERRTLITITVITCLFFMAWSPFFIILLLSVYFPSTLPSYPSMFQLAIFAKWMHHGNSAVNPFIYAFRNVEMRKTFLRLLRGIGCCNRSYEYSNTRFYHSTDRNTYNMESRILRKSSSSTAPGRV